MWAWPSVPRGPKITSLQYLCNIFRKRWVINITFCVKIKIKVFYRLVLSFLLIIAGHAQSTQNNKFAKSLQYLQKVRSEIDVLCRWSSQLILSFLTRHAYFSPGMPKVLKITSMYCLCKISTTNWVMKFMFCMLISMKVF